MPPGHSGHGCHSAPGTASTWPGPEAQVFSALDVAIPKSRIKYPRMRYEREEPAETDEAVRAPARPRRRPKRPRFQGPRLVPEPRAIDLSPGVLDDEVTGA